MPSILFPASGDFGVAVGALRIPHFVGGDVVADALDKELAAFEAICVFLF